MRKLFLHSLFYVIGAILLIACNDDKEKDQHPFSELNKIYSNKMSAPTGCESLLLTYNGQTMIGKEVVFYTENGSTADITLKYVLPHDNETVLTGVMLSTGNGGHTFEGNATSENGTTFSYKGSLQGKTLALQLSDIRIPSNQLTTNETWYIAHANASYYNVDNGNIKTMFGLLYNMVGGKLVGNLISTVLDNMTFQADGNITARYAPLPDSLNIGTLIGTYIPRTEAEWKISPINLATYYVKDESIYITPQIDMIIRQVMMSKQTKADNKESMVENAILAAYARINTWSTTGIKMSIRPCADPTKGDIILVLDKSEIKELFALLGLVQAFLPAETLNAPIIDLIGDMLPPQFAGIAGMLLQGQTVGSMLKQLTTELNTIPIEIGIYLHKDKTNQ